MRSERPSARRARDNIRNASVSSSSEESLHSDSSEFEESSPDKVKSSPQSMQRFKLHVQYVLVSSLDKYTFKNDRSDPASEPWISTIRGTATRLESLKTVVPKKSSKPAVKKVVKKRISSSSEDDMSSEEESELSSSGEESFIGKKKSDEIVVKKKKKGQSSSSDDYSGDSSDAISEKKPKKSVPKIPLDEYSSYDSSESEAVSLETDVEEVATFVVEKILAKRFQTKSKSVHDSFDYLVKWKSRSYAQCEWLPGSELTMDVGSDKRSVKLKNFNSKHPWGPRSESVPQFDDDSFFNPIFLVPERVLSVRNLDEYLIKWTGLPYSESTWEKNDERFSTVVSEFEILNNSCSERVVSDSRKSAGRILDKKADPTADFATQLKAERHVSKNENLENAPMEYEYQVGSELFRIFDFQKEGISWLLFNWSQGRGSMLADEMGLGKTVQTAVTLAQMQRHSDMYKGGPLTFLVIAPLSTIEQWKREIRKWTTMEPVVYHGSKRDRNIIKKYEFEKIDPKSGEIFWRSAKAMMPKFNVMITTFETVSNDEEFFVNSGFVYSAIVVDEAHKLKSNDGKARNSVLAIPTRHRILLTGTPIQNNVSELWNLLHLCSPHYWSDQESFMEEFGNLKSAELTQKLQAKIQPYLLQRRKIDVLSHLVPAKEETIVSVELTRLQKETYRAVYERNLAMLGGTGKNVPSLTNVHMELRKCCNHPFLVQGVEDRVHGRLEGDYPRLMESLIASSGKMVFLDKLLEKLIREKSKILIFSQFTMMLDLIEDYLRYKNYLFERLDGAVKTQQRQESVDRFNKEGQVKSFVFLLSTKAGGVGLNLTAANYVLLFDHDWNPQNDLQAQARCHRIGQTKEVRIFRLVTRGTYEEKMFQVASQKLGLEQAVMSGSTSGAVKLSKEEMDRLLREGAYAMLEDDANEKKFCSEDVDEILQTRTKTVTSFVQGGAAPAGGFSRAKFQVNEDDMDIDVNDPNFWNKMASAGKLEAPLPKDEVQEFLDYQTRKGRATFGAQPVVKRAPGSSLDSEGDDSMDSSEDDRRLKKNGAQTRSRRNPAQMAQDQSSAARGNRMRQIFKFICSFGLIENRETFETKFSTTIDHPVPAYVDMLSLIVSIYIFAKEAAFVSTFKLDEIHFSPVVRAALACLSRFAATGESPTFSDSPINLDAMFPDFFAPISRCDITVPNSLVAQPVPKYVAQAIPKNRNFKKIIADLDEFNEFRFLIRNPNLIRKVPDAKGTPERWILDDDVALITLCLSVGKEQLCSVFAEKFGSRTTEETPAMWAITRLDKLVSRFSQARAIQLTFLVASFGFHQNLLANVLRATGYPWTRKFACAEACLDLLKEDKVTLDLLTPIEPPASGPLSLMARGDEQSFLKFLIAHLPADSPLTTIDVADYAKALLLRVIEALGKKTESHYESVCKILKPSKNNENLFPGVVWPMKPLVRMDAFKLMWRFQTLHFLRTTGNPSVFAPLAIEYGLDSWEHATNVNRHLSGSEVFRSLVKSVVTQQELDQGNLAVKRKISTEASVPSKSMKLTEFFVKRSDDADKSDDAPEAVASAEVVDVDE